MKQRVIPYMCAACAVLLLASGTLRAEDRTFRPTPTPTPVPSVPAPPSGLLVPRH